MTARRLVQCRQIGVLGDLGSGFGGGDSRLEDKGGFENSWVRTDGWEVRVDAIGDGELGFGSSSWS